MALLFFIIKQLQWEKYVMMLLYASRQYYNIP